ncbi:MAG: DNA primase [bacterium]|nr:DNA primase [bacterium]
MSSVTDEIKSRLDIVEYISRYVPLKRAGRTFKAPCPWHSERTASFVVDPDKQFCRCYGACGEGGDIFFFAMKQNGWSFKDALEELAKLAGVELKPQTPEQHERDAARDKLRGILAAAADYFHERLFDSADPDAVNALRYAREQRGMTDSTLQRFKVGFAPAGWQTMQDALSALGMAQNDLLEAGLLSKNEQGRIYDRFRNRLMIPIRDERGRTVGFGARALDPADNPKYLNSPQTLVFDKSHLLFGLDFAAKAIRESETAVIVEGYMDAISLHQAGYPNVVAQMGTALTDAQLTLIAPKWAKRIVMALDSDAAGQNATRRSLEVARNALAKDYAGRLAVEFRILTVPGAKDPDELVQDDPQAWRRLVEAAIPAADFVIDTETRDLPAAASVIEREAVARRLLPILMASENDLYRRDSLQKLALRVRIPERDILAWAAEQQKLQAPSKPTTKPPVGRSAPQTAPQKPASAMPSSAFTAPPEPLDVQQAFDNPYAEVPNFDAPIPPPPAAPAARPPRELVALERYCLRILYQQPDLIYHVNRKFREIAGENTALAQGPLGALAADDFSRSDYRALMVILGSALAQDDYEVYDYVQRNVDSALLEELYALFEASDMMVGVIQDVIPDSYRVRAEDLASIVHQLSRSNESVSTLKEITQKALELRKRRLSQMMQEYHFLQLEQSEDEYANTVDVMLLPTQEAIRRIDAELQFKLPNSRNSYGKKA